MEERDLNDERDLKDEERDLRVFQGELVGKRVRVVVVVLGGVVCEVGKERRERRISERSGSRECVRRDWGLGILISWGVGGMKMENGMRGVRLRMLVVRIKQPRR